MKELQVTVHILEKGDRVITLGGTGTVLKDEVFDELHRYVWVQHDKGLSENPSNEPVELDRNCVHFLIPIPSHEMDCDWQDNECHDEPLSDDILETGYDGDGI